MSPESSAASLILELENRPVELNLVAEDDAVPGRGVELGELAFQIGGPTAEAAFASVHLGFEPLRGLGDCCGGTPHKAVKLPPP